MPTISILETLLNPVTTMNSIVNDNGSELEHFAVYKLKIANTFFCHLDVCTYTWSKRRLRSLIGYEKVNRLADNTMAYTQRKCQPFKFLYSNLGYQTSKKMEAKQITKSNRLNTYTKCIPIRRCQCQGIYNQCLTQYASNINTSNDINEESNTLK